MNTQDRPPETNKAGVDERNNPLNRYTRLLSYFTGLLALFTSLLVITSCVQVWAFMRSERADISFTPIAFDGVFMPNKPPPPLRQEIKNSGRSTATIYKASTMLSTDQHTVLAIEKSYPAHTQIQAGATLHSTIKIEESLSEDAITKINEGKNNLYYLGFIEYDDMFSPVLGHIRTNFCFLYDPRTKQPPGWGNFSDCPA